MNLQKAMNLAAFKHGYKDYLYAQTLSHNNNPWWFIDEVILGDVPVTCSEASVISAGGCVRDKGALEEQHG
jgi:hypothetical protein